MDIVLFIVVGLVAGWLAGVLMKGSSYGVVGDIVVGVLGALIGGALFQRLGISSGGGLAGGTGRLLRSLAVGATHHIH